MPHQHPKLRLSSLEGQILWELEEAGEENIVSLVNTLRRRFAGVSDMEFLEMMGRAVQTLLRLNLISFSPMVAEGLSRFLPLKEVLHWYEDEVWGGGWRWSEKWGGPDVLEIYLTEKGYKDLAE